MGKRRRIRNIIIGVPQPQRRPRTRRGALTIGVWAVLVVLFVAIRLSCGA